MAFDRPTLAALVDRITQDFVEALSLGGAILRRAVVRIFARVIAGAAHMLHGHLEYIGKQILPLTPTGEYLKRWADLYGLQKTAASFATGVVTFTGTNGSVVDTGSALLRADGQRYITTAAATISGGTATAPVTAELAGAAGTLVAAEELTLESTVAGVSSTATVASSTVDGADEETDAALLVRLRERIAFAPHGGAEEDYRTWAKEVSGVTRAWVYPQELGAGTVTVRFVRDNDGDGAAIIPSAGEVTAVQDYIDATTRRPVTAEVTVVAPVAVTRDFTVSITPDTAATRAAVTAELEDLLRRDTIEPGGVLLFSQVEIAVGTAAGVTDFEVTSPNADTNYSTGQLPVMGTVTFT